MSGRLGPNSRVEPPGNAERQAALQTDRWLPREERSAETERRRVEARDLADTARVLGDPVAKVERLMRALEIDCWCIEAVSSAAAATGDLGRRLQMLEAARYLGALDAGAERCRIPGGLPWEDPDARVYIRACRRTVDAYLDAGEVEEVIAGLQYILMVCPGERLATREGLLAILLMARRLPEAAELLRRPPGSPGPTFAWGAVLERWCSGDEAGARDALEEARRRHPGAEALLLARRGRGGGPARQAPPRQGDEVEDDSFCGKMLGPAFERAPGLSAWLRRSRPPR